MPRTSVVALVWLGLSIPAAADGQETFDRAAIDAVFADYNDTVAPGCALGIIESGRLSYARGYGMANLEHGIAIGPGSVFRTGSVSKQFTAAVVAIAVMDGHLDLDDPVQKWVPQIPDYGTPLTVRHLIHHTSGLRDYLTLMSLRGLRSADYYDEVELLEVQARQRELNFAPGSEFLYSNSGYFLLSQIIPAATGQPLKEYAEDVLFGPLGMTQSHFHDDHRHVVARRADGYAPLPGGGFRISMTTLDMVGDGGVYTSVEDLVHWVNALESDRLRPGLSRMLETRGVLSSGDTLPYAFGQRHRTYRGLPVIGHGGSFVGFRADITRFPTARTSIVTLCNRADANPSTRALRVADVVLTDRLGPHQTPASSGQTNRGSRAEAGPVDDPSAYPGVFYSPELDVQYHIEIVDGRLQVRAGAAIPTQLLQLSPDTLRAASRTFSFERTAGTVTGFQLDAGRVQHLRFERVGGG